ncbi:MAG: cupin domain-containing protein [Candidatus Methanomethylicaceae archaeon]
MLNEVLIKNVMDFKPYNLTNPNRTVRIIVDKEICGAEKLSAGFTMIDPLSSTPFHSHDNEEEFIYIIKGKGRFITEKEEYELTDNTVIFVKPGIKHKIENIENSPLWFVFVYSPPGPEKEIYKQSKKL